MTILYFAASMGFFLWLVYLTLFWIYLWQHKEYRLDRMLVHIYETSQGRYILFSFYSLGPLLLLMLFTFILVYPDYVSFYQIFVTFIFLILGLAVINQYLQKTILLPIFTPKALMLFFTTIFIALVLYIVPLAEHFFWLLVITKLISIIVFILVAILSIPTNLYKDWHTDKAIAKLTQQKKLLVIGVAGSFGKSSTKEFAAQILQVNYNVVKTPGLKNTALGVSQTVLSRITPKTNIFIAELAMYKKGEIAETCQIIHPSIGIITGISTQHASLTGELSATIEGKYELINFLPKNGLAMFNGNNANSVELYKRTRKKRILYFFDQENSGQKADIVATNAKATKTSIYFDVTINSSKPIHLMAPLIGLQNIENILPGIYLAKYLGMNKEQIKKAVAELSPLPMTMQKRSTTIGATIIDDTFSTNPDAINAVLEYIKQFSGKKILVLQPMIELGSNAKNEHVEIAKKIAVVCDYLFLTNNNFFGSINRGLEESKGSCFVKAASTKNIAKFVKEIAGSGDVIVFEGHESSLVLNEVI